MMIGDAMTPFDPTGTPFDPVLVSMLQFSKLNSMLPSLFLTHPVCTGVFINVDFLISPSFIKKSQFSPKRMEDKIGTFHYYENLQNVKREICKNCKINFWLELLGFLNNP